MHTCYSVYVEKGLCIETEKRERRKHLFKTDESLWLDGAEWVDGEYETQMVIRGGLAKPGQLRLCSIHTSHESEQGVPHVLSTMEGG